MDLHGKVAVVTGSSSGIGRAVALRFAEMGARVVINSRSNREGGRATVEDICRIGGEAIYIQADVTEEKQVSALFEEVVDNYGTVDILVNNAGRASGVPFAESTLAHWNDMLAANFFSAVLCSIEATKIMRRKGTGRIINTASVRGMEHTGRPGVMAYSAAKAAMINFTRTLAKELAPDILVNAVAPGFVETPYMSTVSDDLKQQWLSSIPLRRFIGMPEIADMYILLATSDVMTGTILVADAGFTLKDA